MSGIRYASLGVAAACGLALSPLAAEASTVLNWTFTADNGVDSGSGIMNVSAKGVVTGLRGTFDGQKLSFYGVGSKAGSHGGLPFNANDPSKGYNTLHGVPNTGGADYIFDDRYVIGTGVDVYGLLVSTGKGASETFYDVSLDYGGAAETDFFSITPSGGYVFRDGTFSTSAASPALAIAFAGDDPDGVAVPEPAAWATMLAGFAGLGAALRMRRRLHALP